LHLVGDRAGFPDVDNGVLRVVGSVGLLAGRLAAAATTAARAARCSGILLVRVLAVVLGVLRLRRRYIDAGAIRAGDR